MEPSQFRDHDGGRVLRHRTGYWYYLPEPMPQRISLDDETQILLSQADAVVGELSGVGRLLTNPHLLIRPYASREALHSSRIEGTRAELGELLYDETSSTGSDEIAEVRNYIRAMNAGIESLALRPIASRLVLELHGMLLTGVRGQERTPGEFRRSQNWIGPAGSAPMTAPYVPPPPEELPAQISDWEKFVNRVGRIPDLVQCALLHERFETIHPFLDGNGRVGRLLVTMFLIQRRRLVLPLLYLSSHIERTKTEYGEALQRVRTDGDTLGWIRYFLTAVIGAGEEAIRQTEALRLLRLEMIATYAGIPRVQALIETLFANPFVTVRRAAEELHVTHPTATKAIERLLQDQVLRQVNEGVWGRVFVSDRVLDALSNPPPPVVETAPIG